MSTFTLVWMMVGILMLTITLFVHRHTYTFFGSKRLPLPIWLLLLMIFFALTPVANLIIFIMGGAMYSTFICGQDIVFRCDSKWFKAIKGFLIKEI